jgi:hypothetical protein
MTSRYASVLHALSVEPRTARPGETVRMIFRTRNLGAVPSPPGAVRFLPVAGLDVVADGGTNTAAGAVIAVEPAPPGDDVVAEIDARVAQPMDDGTTLDVQAVLEIDGASFGTNVCSIVVRSRAVLDGPLSGTFVEAIGDDMVRVRAVVTNEGDGPARNVRIVVPAPIGTVACDDEQVAATKDVARIEAGQRVEITFDARIVEPVRSVCADGAFVVLAGGTRCAIPALGEMQLVPLLARADVEVTPSRRRVDVSATVRNDGWADACDVRVRIALPAELRLVESSAVVDCVPVVPRAARGRSRDTSFARLEKADGAIVVAIGRIPARSAVRVSLAAHVPAGYEGGEIAVGGNAACPEVAVPFVIEPVRDVRVRIVDVPRAGTPGERVAITAEVSNLGDVPETVTVRTAVRDLVLDEGACTLTVQPGHVAPAVLALDVPDTCGGARLPVTVVVSDNERERARAEYAVVVRPVVSAVAAAASLAAEPQALREMPRMPAVRAVLVAPSDVMAGAPFGVTLMVDAVDAMERLTIRVPAPRAAPYVAASTVLDGCVLLDRAGSSPLHGEGLTLHDLRGSTHLAVTWTMLAAAAADVLELELTASLDADGTSIRIEPVTVTLFAGAMFSVRPAGLPYHVDARAVDAVRDVAQVAFGAHDGAERMDSALAATDHDSGISALLRDIGLGPPFRDAGLAMGRPQTGGSPEGASSSEDEPGRPMFELRLDGDRVEEIARSMRGASANTLISHVVALRALLPCVEVRSSTATDPASSNDTGSIARALGEAVDATRDVFDRLFVKLRIPGFGVTASDLEDPAMRRALVVLFRTIGEDASIAAFAGAPLGSAETLRALVGLVPTRCNAEPLLGAALHFYASALDEALAHFSSTSGDFYELALARDAGFMLADARDAVASALPAATLAGAA